MQHSLRLTVGLTALALAAGCADNPVAPNGTAGLAEAGRQGTNSTPEYNWTFDKKVFAVLYGKHMLPEDRTDETFVVPGDVKWIEYTLTANKSPAATYPAGTVISKDAKAAIHEKLWESCKKLFPMVHCTWGLPHPITFAPYTIDESTVRTVMVDLRNFYVCGEDFRFTNTATLTELGPVPAGRAPEVHTSSATLLVKTGACPPKPANPGCTFTQGYWKNHDWPQHPIYTNSTLETWEEVNGWSESEWHFMDTSIEWKDVLSIQPRGDAYFILAHQYIAAVLNQANGTWVPPQVRDVLVKSYDYFSLTPAERAVFPREKLTSWAAVLDDYNSGKLGVAHCDDGGKNNGKNS